MTARNRFDVKLLCPKCGQEGTAKLSELDGYSYAFGSKTTSVDELPAGFLIVTDQPSSAGSVDLHCLDCLVSAVKP